MISIKLTDPDGYTRRGQAGETLWVPGQTVTPAGVGTRQCGPGVLHAYCAPEVAVLGDPIHAGLLPGARCFQVEIAGGRWDTDGLKRWTSSPLRVLGEIPVPELPLLERVAWAITIAPHPSTREWAIEWLSGRDRSAEAAEAAARAAACAAEAYAEVEAYAAEAAARAAARAAACAEAYAEAYAEAAQAAAQAAEEAYAATATAAESRLVPVLRRARAILAGEWPAERYDEP